MKNLITLCLFYIFIFTDKNYKVDFGTNKDGKDWLVINDGVMGGLSQGDAQLKENSILFKGTVSLDNNGGFSSLRSSFAARDLSNYTQLTLRYRSTGVSKAITLSISRRWYVPNYKKSLPDTNSEWKIITVNLKDFDKYYIGRKIRGELTKEILGKILRIGFITDEKKYGDFEFEVDYIGFK